MEFNKRNFELLYQHQNFSNVSTELEENAELFALAGGADGDFRQAFKDSPFKDSPSIPCRLSYDFEEQPSEAELIEHLKTVGITNTDASDTDHYALLPNVYSAVMWLAGMMRAEQIGRVIVASLVPGGHIGAHKDFGAYHDFYDRFHLCISGEGCYFRSGRETVKMLPGEVWWFYNNDEHEVWNDTAVPRYHVVVDLKLKGEKMELRTGEPAAAGH